MTNSLKKPFIAVIKTLGKRKEQNRFTDPPILLGGCARSGTTLLLSILSSHEDIFACRRELGLFNDVEMKNGTVNPIRIDRIYRCLLVHRIPQTARRWCEKSPANIREFPHIDTYFEGNFRFIQIVRDGRDVILSRHPRDTDRYWVEPQRWVDDVSLGTTFIDHPNFHTIRYEDLINNYVETVTGICEFLGISLTDRILNWHQHASVRRNNALYSEIGKLSDRSIGKWKKPENKHRVRQLTDLPEAMVLLEKYGYLEQLT
jgi:hypothetical protein